jgi:hypothetical protein
VREPDQRRFERGTLTLTVRSTGVERLPAAPARSIRRYVRFSDAGRNFDVLLGFGSKLTGEGRREA